MEESCPWVQNEISNFIVICAGFNVGKGSKKFQQKVQEINQDACHLPGFTVLQWLLPKHASVPEIYFLLLALSMGHIAYDLPTDCEVSVILPQIAIRTLYIATLSQYSSPLN